MGEEEAFWQSIGVDPFDQLPRLVFADWLEERSRYDEAAALRATADRSPKSFPPERVGWVKRSVGTGNHDERCLIDDDVCELLEGNLVPWNTNHAGYWWDYRDGTEAIRAVCPAWVLLHR